MFATTGYIQGNEEKPAYVFASDDAVQKISDALIKQNIEAYRELAK